MWPWRKRKLSDGEFLRLVMRTVASDYSDREIELRPPQPRQKYEDVEARAHRTLRELIKMVK
jgi:hypothetical protein